jgi:hypothetical protein
MEKRSDDTQHVLSFAPAWRWAGWLWRASFVVFIILLTYDVYYFFSEEGKLEWELSMLPPGGLFFFVVFLQSLVAALLGLVLLPLAALRRDKKAARTALECLFWPLLYLGVVLVAREFLMADFRKHAGDCYHEGFVKALPYLCTQMLGVFLSPLFAWRIRRLLKS